MRRRKQPTPPAERDYAQASITIKKEVLDKLRKTALEENRSVSQQIEYIVKHHAFPA